MSMGSISYLTSHLFFGLFILSSIILSLESFCGITYMQECQKLPSDFQVRRCVIGQAYPLPFTSHTFFMCWAVTRSKRGWFCFILFYLKAALSSRQYLNTGRCFVTQQVLLSGCIVFAVVSLSGFLYVCITTSDSFFTTSDNPELLEVKFDKIRKIGKRGLKVSSSRKVYSKT